MPSSPALLLGLQHGHTLPKPSSCLCVFIIFCQEDRHSCTDPKDAALAEVLRGQSSGHFGHRGLELRRGATVLSSVFGIADFAAASVSAEAFTGVFCGDGFQRLVGIPAVQRRSRRHLERGEALWRQTLRSARTVQTRTRARAREDDVATNTRPALTLTLTQPCVAVKLQDTLEGD
ncbi:hypothetical protein AOLI_G00304920 [Acnodon oligacanthus]